jgi:hypothetical protein
MEHLESTERNPTDLKDKLNELQKENDVEVDNDD